MASAQAVWQATTSSEVTDLTGGTDRQAIMIVLGIRVQIDVRVEVTRGRTHREKKGFRDDNGNLKRFPPISAQKTR